MVVTTLNLEEIIDISRIFEYRFKRPMTTEDWESYKLSYMNKQATNNREDSIASLVALSFIP